MRRKTYMTLTFLFVTYSCLVSSGFGTTYNYDNLHRLTRVSYENGTVITYTYDEVGNRTQRVSTLMADASLDGQVNFSDFAVMAAKWLEQDCGYADEWCTRADLDWSTDVTITDLTIAANQWLEGTAIPDSGIVWISVEDLGVDGHEAFNGQMSKYETTNAQYCQFLNAALASGDITVDSNTVIGANGSNSGADFVGEVYYNLAGAGFTAYGATNGGAARVNFSDGVFSVDSGFENHPVSYVSWYGATAFCNYYGYRLPTEWEWQAVADYDASYTYGCGTSINNSIANYQDTIHPNGTTIVDAFGTYGYGVCDMAGNVWEWTNSVDGSNRVLRGGSWHDGVNSCAVSFRYSYYPYYTNDNYGFRVCR